jgi:hypothetical protein
MTTLLDRRGDYQDPDFRSLIPGTEKMVGPFDDERKARNEWIRLTLLSAQARPRPLQHRPEPCSECCGARGIANCRRTFRG